LLLYWLNPFNTLQLLAIEIVLMCDNRSYVNEFLVLLFENLNRDADGIYHWSYFNFFNLIQCDFVGGHEMMASHKVPTQRSILQFLNGFNI